MDFLAYGIRWSKTIVDLTLSSKQRSLVNDVAHPSENENIPAQDEEENELEILTHIISL